MAHFKNPPISDETLMGYILMALPEEEIARIDEQVMRDPTLSQRICELRELLAPVQISQEETFEPSSNLVSNTLAFVESRAAEIASASAKRSGGMTEVFESAGRGTKLAWLDSLASVAAGVALACLLVPSIWQCRENARKLNCANKLQGLGLALHAFANSNVGGEFPGAEIEGPLAFAGVYALKLKNAQLLDSTNLIWCPSSSTVQLQLQVPGMHEYLRAPLSEQMAWQRTIGGTYAYNLGNIVNGKYIPPRLECGAIVPLAGDTVATFQGDIDCERLIHGVNTVNLLFTDGRVLHVRLQDLDSDGWVDHPYFNRNQMRAVGLGKDDTCLAPSFVPPLTRTAGVAK